MRWIEAAGYEEMSKIAADLFITCINENSKSVVGLATGATPEYFYKELIKRCSSGEVSFAGTTSFNLDEYVGVSAESEASYHHYMKRNLFDHIDIKPEDIHLPNGDASDLEQAATEYEAQIKAAGGIDIQLLGIGVNGHIGFNEPGSSFEEGTHVVELTASTRQANKVYFERLEDVPTHALTMGIKTIMQSKRIVLLISGASKQEAYDRLRAGQVTEQFPASVLHLHEDVTVIYTGVE
ncbi:MAG: glucosamine-6-phosphate deaminase [Lysinibacillus sp.]